MGKEFFDAAHRQSKYWKLGKTKRWYSGAVPDVTQIGDYICIFHEFMRDSTSFYRAQEWTRLHLNKSCIKAIDSWKMRFSNSMRGGCQLSVHDNTSLRCFLYAASLIFIQIVEFAALFQPIIFKSNDCMFNREYWKIAPKRWKREADFS